LDYAKDLFDGANADGACYSLG